MIASYVLVNFSDIDPFEHMIIILFVYPSGINYSGVIFLFFFIYMYIGSHVIIICLLLMAI